MPTTGSPPTSRSGGDLDLARQRRRTTPCCSSSFCEFRPSIRVFSGWKGSRNKPCRKPCTSGCARQPAGAYFTARRGTAAASPDPQDEGCGGTTRTKHQHTPGSSCCCESIRPGPYCGPTSTNVAPTSCRKPQSGGDKSPRISQDGRPQDAAQHLARLLRLLVQPRRRYQCRRQPASASTWRKGSLHWLNWSWTRRSMRPRRTCGRWRVDAVLQQQAHESEIRGADYTHSADSLVGHVPEQRHARWEVQDDGAVSKDTRRRVPSPRPTAAATCRCRACGCS